MLAISLEFLHSTFRGDPDGTANTGRSDRGEWPPSVARLFAALVAAEGTGDNCRLTNGAELAWFERLPPPSIHAFDRPCHNPVRPRYIVRHDGKASKSTHQEYPARSAALVRPGVRVSMRDPQVVYSWNVAPSRETLRALRCRAARIAYVGSSDSPVRVRVGSEVPSQARQVGAYIPDPSGDTIVAVARPGDLAVLDLMYGQWVEHGAAVTRLQFPALRHEVPYRSPQQRRIVDRGVVVAWLRLGRYVSGRRVSAMTALFKEAVLSQHQRIHGEPAAVLHGHGVEGKGYEIARYLALPDVGYERSRGRIHGLALWMPPQSDRRTRGMARDAAHAIRQLAGRGIDVSVFPRGDEQRPVAAQPSRWLRRSRRWVTAFPAIHERRRSLDLSEVARWCSHAGLPEPIGFRSGRSPLVTGAVDLAPAEINRPGRAGLPYCHVEVWFAEPVPGPVVIGSGRQRGFGLCVPMDDGGKDSTHAR